MTTTKYERTGETTDDPAVAVGWGVWRDAEGFMRQLATDDGVARILYKVTPSAHWAPTPYIGERGPFTRMRAVVEPRSGAELRRWLVAHPGVEVAQNSARRRWNYVEARFEETSSDSWSTAPDEWVWSMAPADGSGWAR